MTLLVVDGARGVCASESGNDTCGTNSETWISRSDTISPRFPSSIFTVLNPLRPHEPAHVAILAVWRGELIGSQCLRRRFVVVGFWTRRGCHGRSGEVGVGCNRFELEIYLRPREPEGVDRFLGHFCPQDEEIM
jgi:hypothetical protein